MRGCRSIHHFCGVDPISPNMPLAALFGFRRDLYDFPRLCDTFIHVLRAPTKFLNLIWAIRPRWTPDCPARDLLHAGVDMEDIFFLAFAAFSLPFFPACQYRYTRKRWRAVGVYLTPGTSLFCSQPPTAFFAILVRRLFIFLRK